MSKCFKKPVIRLYLHCPFFNHIIYIMFQKKIKIDVESSQKSDHSFNTHSRVKFLLRHSLPVNVNRQQRHVLLFEEFIEKKFSKESIIEPCDSVHVSFHVVIFSWIESESRLSLRWNRRISRRCEMKKTGNVSKLKSKWKRCNDKSLLSIWKESKYMLTFQWMLHHIKSAKTDKKRSL